MGGRAPAPRTSFPATTSIFTAPMIADPGTGFVYGINTDWLGKVVEAAGGTTLDVAIKDGITGPLGMDETSFLMPTTSRAADSTPVHVKGEDGSWVATDIDLRQDPEYWAGGHGLYSTPTRLPQLPAGAAARRHVRRRAILQTGDGGRRVHQPDRRPRLPAPASRPPTRPSTPRLQRRAGLQVGLRAAAQHRRHPRDAARGHGAWAGCSTPTSGSTARTGITRCDLLAVPAVRARRRRSRSTTAFEQALYAALVRPGWKLHVRSRKTARA